LAIETNNLLVQIMRTIHFMHALLATSLMLAAVSASAAEPLRVRLLTYNIHHGEGVDGKLDLERIAKVIKSVDPDLVALQEVDQKVERTRSVDQPAELARLTEMHVVFGANLALQGGHYGNAVLSRNPIVRWDNHLLPNIAAGEQRGVLEAEMKLTGSENPLLLFATHLDHRQDEQERLASAKTINALADKQPDRPALLAGDFNDVPESKTLEELATRWETANTEPIATVPVDRPAKQIDYLFFRPKARWKAIDIQVLDEATASDHRAVFAVLELLPKGE
jgi:endonuclease/exonuclease/phosphatase family metal-dependent hydrolase